MKYFMTEFGKAVVNSGKRRDGWKKGIEKGEGKARYLRTKADFQYRKRVEKQIAEMQDKSDKIRMQVIQAHSSNKSSMS
jgi:N-acetyl-beta-hexosaminidase